MPKTVDIRVLEYYDKPQYYSVMPQEIFDTLEAAFLAADETAAVDRIMYETMMAAYRAKQADGQKRKTD